MSNNRDEKFESKTKEYKPHSNSLECLKTCSNYNLLITSHQKNIQDYSYFSRVITSDNNNIFLINNVSSKEIINNIAELSINNNKKFLCSYNYEKLFENTNNNINQIYKEKKIKFPLESKRLNLNFIDYPKNLDFYRNNKGLNLLIKYDLNDQNDPFILDKNIIFKLLSFKLNAKLHETNSLLDKDIFLLLDVKKIIKSIQIQLEYIKKKISKKLGNLEFMFIPLLEYPNIGIIISENSNLPILNINKIKTNFNSVIKRKFIIKSILIAINISMVIENNLSSNNNYVIKKIEINKEKINDNINDETTTTSSSNSPKTTNQKLIEKLDYNYKLNESLNDIIFNDNNSQIYDDLNINNNEMYINNFLLYNYKNILKKEYLLSNTNDIKQNKFVISQPFYDISTIIINSDDIFAKTLFNRYQDKSNSTCNLIVLIEFLKIKIMKSLNELSLLDFFSSFSNISTLCLKIPFFNIDGNIIKASFTPFLNEIQLFIKNHKFIKRIEKKFKLNKIFPENNNSSLNDENNKIYNDYKGFKIEILENKALLKISYKEKKPYYQADSLSDKLEQLINLFKSLKKININKNVLINNSYISIGWNSINTNNLFTSSFYSYYLFNGNFIGIILNVKESEKNFWINSVEEIKNNQQVINYDYLIIENARKVNDFINNNGRLNFKMEIM